MGVSYFKMNIFRLATEFCKDAGHSFIDRLEEVCMYILNGF